MHRWRNSICGAVEINFIKAFREQLTFKLTLEKSLYLLQPLGKDCDKGIDIWKVCIVLNFGVSKIAQIFLIALISTVQCFIWLLA